VQAISALDDPGHPDRRRPRCSARGLRQHHRRPVHQASTHPDPWRRVLQKPFLTPIPGAEFLQTHALPYIFLLMVGVALVRKPGCVTAMVFINFLLAQLLFGSGHGALDWTDGLTQAIFCDLYIVARRGAVYAPGVSKLSMV